MMATTPIWKVYRGSEYIGCCKYAEDAAALVSLTVTGTVKYGHGVVLWREGQEEFSAGESYNGAAEIMENRLHDHNLAAYKRIYGKSPENAQ